MHINDSPRALLISLILLAGCSNEPPSPPPSFNARQPPPSVHDRTKADRPTPTNEQFEQLVGCYDLGVPTVDGAALPRTAINAHLMLTPTDADGYLVQFLPASSTFPSSWHLEEERAYFAWSTRAEGYEFALTSEPPHFLLWARYISSSGKRGSWQRVSVQKVKCTS